MAQQLALRMPLRMLYAAENFLVHAGAQPLVDLVFGVGRSQRFGCLALSVPPRSGRTHFSIFLVAKLVDAGAIPYLVEGEEFGAFMAAPERAVITSAEVFVVDNAERYFSGVTPGNSGAFVAFYERVRQAGGTLILLFDRLGINVPCDEHVLSRLKAATVGALGEPAEADLPELIRLIARQRGYKLTPKKLEFLTKRLGRSIPQIDEYFDRVQHLSDVFGQPIHFPLLHDAL